MTNKLTTGDLDKILDILVIQYNKRDQSKLPTPEEQALLSLMNKLQEYLYNKEV